eukprot:TRINITY_DN63715_c0_g1_i1.p1 TRINITY_DN63715_c0_g1~~TRINITY_DN63715_c0_g1_i1.p1  ORF type:complete len:331 (+),score=-18.76 TRINITY_DN63715_c0_g1_i1:155-1147(+)
MWLRLHKQLKQILSKNQEDEDPSPQQLLQFAIKEIDASIVKNEKALLDLHKNQAEINTTLNDYQFKLRDLEAEAKNALRKNNEKLAQSILKQKANVEKHYLEYKSISNNTNQAIHQLVMQLDNLKLQRKETKSKEVILKAKLESAQSNLELNQYLNELENTQSIELYEDEINRIEIEASLTNEVLTLENELQDLEAENNVASFREEMQREEEEKKRKAEEAQRKRINNMFESAAPKTHDPFNKKQKALEEAKEKILSNFRSSKTEKNPSNTKIDSFFNETKNPPKKEPVSSQNQKSIDNFFNKKEAPSPQKKNDSDGKQNLIDDFFNKEN